jgi:hypothetical protein
MSATTQLAVRMTGDQLADLDWIVVHLSLDSRAEGIRKAVEMIKKELRERDIDRQLADFYAGFEDDVDDVEHSTRRAIESIEAEPWEKWW